MLTAIISFFGSSVFRLVWGELSTWWTARQDHKQQIDLIELQERQAAAQHARNLEAIRLQADLGERQITLKGAAAVEEIETSAWLRAVEGTTKAIGIAWVDAWNAAIRPALATWSIIIITLHYAGAITLDDYGWSLCGASLGLFLGDRMALKRGK